MTFLMVLLIVCALDRNPVTGFLMWSAAAVAFWWAMLR
jgi:hypothetical protein